MISQRKALIVVAVLVVAFAASQGVDARGLKHHYSLWCTQGGTEVKAVDAGTQFTVNGSGFKGSTKVRVCISAGRACDYTSTDRRGEFHSGWTLYEPGTFTIVALEETGRGMREPVERSRIQVMINAR